MRYEIVEVAPKTYHVRLLKGTKPDATWITVRQESIVWKTNSLEKALEKAHEEIDNYIIMSKYPSLAACGDYPQ